MESDSEMDALDSALLSKFQSMGTTDKDVLISQFQSLLGFQLNPAGCAFFLDMTNWNLQSAVGAYYDFEGGQECTLPSMTFVLDVTVGEGESVPPSTPFTKTWRVRNSGKEDWPGGCSLRFLNGEKFSAQDSVPIPVVPSGATFDISINLVSPATPGTYQGQWRMYNSTGTPFGDIIWVIISVTENGLLGITQQISRVSCNINGEGASLSKESSTSMQNSIAPSCVDEEMVMEETAAQNNLHGNSNIIINGNSPCTLFNEGTVAMPLSNSSSRDV